MIRGITVFVLMMAILAPVSGTASPESKLIFWGGIKEQQVGEDAGQRRGDKYPFLARLVLRNKRNRSAYVGSGALIAKDWMITAKHVASGFLKDPDAYNFKVTFPDGTTRQVAKAFGHANRDVAILKFDKPVTHIQFPSIQSKEIPSTVGRDGMPVSITGANGGVIAYDVYAFSNGRRLFSPDILRAGDSGSPIIGRDADGKPIVLGTLIGPYRLSNRGSNQFIRNMSYAQFTQTGGLKDWFAEKMGDSDVVRWSDLNTSKNAKENQPVMTGTPEYQLNRATFLYLDRQPKDAKEIVLKLLPKLEGRMRESIAKTLLTKCRQAEQRIVKTPMPSGEAK